MDKINIGTIADYVLVDRYSFQELVRDYLHNHPTDSISIEERQELSDMLFQVLPAKGSA